MSNVEKRNCPLCQTECDLDFSKGTGMAVLYFSCRICGTFLIENQVGTEYFARGGDYRLSASTRHANERNEVLTLTHNNVDDLIRVAPTTLREKAASFLRHLENKTSYYGLSVPVTGQDYPLAYCRQHLEFSHVLEAIIDMGYIDMDEMPKIFRDSNAPEFYVCQTRITRNGWQFLEELSGLRPESRKAFVAMSFDPKLRYVFDQGIKPACEANGFEAIRVDNEQFNDVVYDRIIAGINESRFLIVDVTQQKNGVYFEGGYAKGRGMTVIWTWKCDEEAKPHFDIQKFNHIYWKTVEELKDRLELRIRATIGSIKRADHWKTA